MKYRVPKGVGVSRYTTNESRRGEMVVSQHECVFDDSDLIRRPRFPTASMNENYRYFALPQVALPFVMIAVLKTDIVEEGDF